MNHCAHILQAVAFMMEQSEIWISLRSSVSQGSQLMALPVSNGLWEFLCAVIDYCNIWTIVVHAPAMNPLNKLVIYIPFFWFLDVFCCLYFKLFELQLGPDVFG